MRVLNIQNYNNQPSFNAWHREVRKPIANLTKNTAHKDILKPTIEYAETVINRNDTWFYRDHPDWFCLTNFLVKRFKDVPKINIYNYACSNGSEAYTFIMEMLSHFEPEVTKKFMPVIAKDIDPVAIKEAKYNLHDLREEEILDINRNTNYKFNSFFKKSEQVGAFGALYEPTKLLTENVEFYVANILEDYKNIEPNNSVVFARNFWPYLEEKQRYELASKLYQQLGDNSLLIYGNYDFISTYHSREDVITDIFETCGFRPTQIGYVLEKNPDFKPIMQIWK